MFTTAKQGQMLISAVTGSRFQIFRFRQVTEERTGEFIEGVGFQSWNGMCKRVISIGDSPPTLESLR